jgi:arylsulfatase A-like enzyme
LLITLDTQRADHCSMHGYPRATTPHLDEIATQGAMFAAAYTPTPTTGPSHASLFTSSYPLVHGVLKNGYPLTPEQTTLAEMLQHAGYATAAVVSTYALANRFGYGQGYAYYDDEFVPAEASILLPEWEGNQLEGSGFDRRGDATTARAIRWLASARDKAPFFLWVHYYDPHEPYDPPKGYRRLFAGRGGSRRTLLERATAAYDAEIRFADDQIGRLIDEHDRTVGAAGTLLIIATDHGEGLMQHGWMRHGVNLYEELVRTLLVFRWPGRIAGGRRFTEPVSLIDVTPTVLTLLGIVPDDVRFQGIDLSPALLHGAALPMDRPVYFQRRVYKEGDRHGRHVAGEMYGLRLRNWKYIEAPAQQSWELFDLAADPAETTSLRETEPATASALADLLHAWIADAAGGRTRVEQSVSAEDAARLRALGYVD